MRTTDAGDVLRNFKHDSYSREVSLSAAFGYHDETNIKIHYTLWFQFRAFHALIKCLGLRYPSTSATSNSCARTCGPHMELKMAKHIDRIVYE